MIDQGQEFFDRLVSLCRPEIAKAMRDGDADLIGEIIEGLATMLGRTIGRALAKDPAAIDRMLIGCEQLIASEAASMAEIQKFADAARLKRGGK